MANLDTRCKNQLVILNIPNGMSIDTFNSKMENVTDMLDRLCYHYAYIYHDKDTDKDGNLKTPHIHLVTLGTTRVRLSTMLNHIADALGFTTITELNTIQIDKCDSIPLSLQYLTHKNNDMKYQYDVSSITTNIPPKDFDDYYNSIGDVEITTAYLFDLVKSGKSDVEIMFIIGIGRYHVFRGAIGDIRYALSHTPNLTDEFLNSLESKGN